MFLSIFEKNIKTTPQKQKKQKQKTKKKTKKMFAYSTITQLQYANAYFIMTMSFAWVGFSNY